MENWTQNKKKMKFSPQKDLLLAMWPWATHLDETSACSVLWRWLPLQEMTARTEFNEQELIFAHCKALHDYIVFLL